jgi:hypothetical protein
MVLLLLILQLCQAAAMTNIDLTSMNGKRGELLMVAEKDDVADNVVDGSRFTGNAFWREKEKEQVLADA